MLVYDSKKIVFLPSHSVTLYQQEITQSYFAIIHVGKKPGNYFLNENGK